LIEDISELFDTNEDNSIGGLKPLHVSSLSCGRRHCMATFDYGSFFFWGDNEHGQLGNRKRSFSESPYPKRKFELHHNVEKVICDIDSSCVIVETPDELTDK
jgi:alpha-tubulin suppressor-like RCC1 family protein